MLQNTLNVFLMLLKFKDFFDGYAHSSCKMKKKMKILNQKGR